MFYSSPIQNYGLALLPSSTLAGAEGVPKRCGLIRISINVCVEGVKREREERAEVFLKYRVNPEQ